MIKLTENQIKELKKQFRKEIDKHSEEIGFSEPPSYHIGMDSAYAILEDILEGD